MPTRRLPDEWASQPLRLLAAYIDETTTQEITANGILLRKLAGVSLEGLPLPIPDELEVHPLLPPIEDRGVVAGGFTLERLMYVTTFRYRVRALETLTPDVTESAVDDKAEDEEAEA